MKTSAELINEIVDLSNQICTRYDDMIKRNNDMIEETAQYIEMCIWSMQASAQEIKQLNNLWGI